MARPMPGTALVPRMVQPPREYLSATSGLIASLIMRKARMEPRHWARM